MLDPRLPRRGNGMLAHRRSERMGGIDQMGDALLPQIAHEACNPAKAADAYRHRLRPWLLRAPGVAQQRARPPLGKSCRERAGFGGPAQYEDVGNARYS